MEPDRRLHAHSGESAPAAHRRPGGRNLPQHELIGLGVRVASAADPTHVGVSGTVVDESRNMISVDTGKKVVKIPKKGTAFEFAAGDGRARVAGDDITFRPEDRVKRCRR